MVSSLGFRFAGNCRNVLLTSTSPISTGIALTQELNIRFVLRVEIGGMVRRHAATVCGFVGDAVQRRHAERRVDLSLRNHRADRDVLTRAAGRALFAGWR